MRPTVTSAAAPPSPTPTPSAFASRVRRLRLALIVALAIAAPLVVALVTHSNRSGVEDAYMADARADATAVARSAVSEPRAKLPRALDRLQEQVPELAGIAVYRGNREIASTGDLSGGLVVDAPGSGQRVARVAWDTTRVDAAIAERQGGFPLALAIGVGGAALLIYLLVSRLGLSRLTRLADQLSEGQQSLEALALADPLTGLPNKRAFNDRLEAELGRAAREYYPVSIVALDLDKFKQINDTWGHAVGDEALVKLSRALQETLRAGDICGRMGGDEFMLALVRADAATAEKVMQRIKDAVAPIEVGPDRQKLRFSAGIAEFPRHSTEMETLANQADAALYWGKANGRDRWHVYSAEAGEALGTEATGGPNEGVKRRNMMATLQQLAKAVDAKNRYTTDHSDRVAGYAVALAKSLKLHDDRVERIRTAALLHDVGKIGIPTPVLLKEGALNLEDLDQLARHSELGHAMIAGAGMPEEARIVFHVHERWDGGGYPDKLIGEAIPLESRIIHAADSLDRATRPTAYRKVRPLREALAEVEFSAGTKLDPEICARLVSMVRGGEVQVPGHETGPVHLRDRRAAAAG